MDILINNAGWTDEPYFPDGSPLTTVSSVAGLGYGPHDSPEYAAAKAGLIRFTAALAPLRERQNVRVNCVVPHWIATEHVMESIRRMTPQERARVPERLNEPDEIADAVVELVRDDGLAGRVMVCWCGEPRRLIDASRRE